MPEYREDNRDSIYNFYYKRNRIQQIRGFITVAQEGTFAEASEVLRISKSSVFSQVKSLENKLGITLFQKEGRNVILTNEGKTFYEKSLPILSSIDNLYEDFVDNYLTKYHKILKLAGHYIFLTKFLPKSLTTTLKNDNSLKFEIDSSHKYEAFDKLQDGKLDIVFYPCDKRDIKEYKNLSFKKLTEYKMCAMFGNETHLTQNMVDNLYDNFDKFNLLIPRKQPIVTKRAEENLRGVKKNIISVEGFSMAKELAKNNLGVCFFDSSYYTEEDKKDLKILYLPRNETFDLHYYAITRKDTQMKEGIKNLLANINEDIYSKRKQCN